MDLKDQIEADLGLIELELYQENVKQSYERVLFNLKTNLNFLEIVDQKDPFVILITGILDSKNNITNNNNVVHKDISVILNTIKILTEVGLLRSHAISFVFEKIHNRISYENTKYVMKVLQTNISVFESPILDEDVRYKALDITLKFCGSSSSSIKDIAKASLYQILDLLIDQIYYRNRSSLSFFQGVQRLDVEQAIDEVVSLNTDIINESDNSVVNMYDTQRLSKNLVPITHWSINLLIYFLLDLLHVITGGKSSKFTDLAQSSEDFPFYLMVIKHIVDNHIHVILSYKGKSRDIIDLLLKFSESQNDSKFFVMFAPHIILNLHQYDLDKTKMMCSKIMKLFESNPRMLITLSFIFVSNPSIIFNIFSEEDLKKITNSAAKYVIANYRGLLNEPISIYGNQRPGLNKYDPFLNSTESMIAAAIRLIFIQVTQSVYHLEYFKVIFSDIEMIWQRIIQTTEEFATYLTCLKISRTCIKLLVIQGDYESQGKMLNTLSQLAFPSSITEPLTSKRVFALHTIIKLLKFLTSKISKHWFLFFDTINNCYMSALQKKTLADEKALALTDLSILSFCTNISDDHLKKMIKIYIQLSDQALENTQPNINFWPLQCLIYIFSSNLHRSDIIEEQFFTHIRTITSHSDAEIRLHVTRLLFNLSKNIITSKECPSRQQVFDFIFKVANSEYSDVSVEAYNNLILFLSGDTSKCINEGWIMLITLLKNVWLSDNEEKIVNGSRTLNFICNDCLGYLNIDCMEILVHTITNYASKSDDINIALSSINLYWSVATGLSELKNENKSHVWITLFKNINIFFDDKRTNIQISSLETFSNIIGAFGDGIEQSVKEYIYNNSIIPLIKKTHDTLVKRKDYENYKYWMRIVKNMLQILKFFDHYEETMVLCIECIEEMTFCNDHKRQSVAVKLYGNLLSFKDDNIFTMVTSSLDKTTEYVCNAQLESLLQLLSTLMNEAFKIYANDISQENFDKHMAILIKIISFRSVKEHLAVGSISALNMLSALKLNHDRMHTIFKSLLKLLAGRASLLTVKLLEIISLIYKNSFDENQRSKCLTSALPVLMKYINTRDGLECLTSIIQLPVLLNDAANDKSTVCILVNLVKRYRNLYSSIIYMLSKSLSFLRPDSLPTVFSLATISHDIVINFFENYCYVGTEHIDFAKTALPYAVMYVDRKTNEILDQERSLGTILKKSSYNDMVKYLTCLTSIKTDPNIYNIDDCGDIGHLHITLKAAIKLTESKNLLLRSISQKIIALVNNVIL